MKPIYQAWLIVALFLAMMFAGCVTTGTQSDRAYWEMRRAEYKRDAVFNKYMEKRP